MDFKPGDPVIHNLTREEGVVKSLHLFRIGSNAGDCLLVTVGKEEKVWLCDETTHFDSTNRTSTP